MTPRYWTTVPDVPGHYWTARNGLETRFTDGTWAGYGMGVHPPRAWFFGPLPTAYDPAAPSTCCNEPMLRAGADYWLCKKCGRHLFNEAADLDRECKVAFAEMEIADTKRPDGDLPFDGHEELWLRFMRDGERTPDLLTAMRELTGRMQQSPTNG